MSRVAFPAVNFLALIALCILFVGAVPFDGTAAASSSSTSPPSGQSQSDGGSGNQQFTEDGSRDDSGPFPVTLVSGFYGPGAFVSWILVAVSTILDKLFEPTAGVTDQHRDPSDGVSSSSDSSSAKEQTKKLVYGQILGLDLNLLSTLAYPCIAAVNACLYFHKLQRGGGMEADDVARLAAPVAVLRAWTNTLGTFLIATWAAKISRGGPKTSGKMYINISSGLLVRRDIIAVLLWVLALSAMKLFFLVIRHYAHMSAEEWEYVELVARMNPETVSFEPIAYAMVMFLALGYFFYFLWEESPSWKEFRVFALVLAVYLVCLIVEASFDAIYCRRLWILDVSEKHKPFLLDAGLTSAYSTVSLRMVNQNEELSYFQNYFTDILNAKQEFELLYGAYPRVWGIAEDLVLWPASVLQINPWILVKIAAKIQVVIGWIFLSVLGIAAVIIAIALVISLLSLVSSLVSDDLADNAADVRNGAFALLAMVLYCSMVGDVTLFWTALTTWLQILFPVFRPDLLLPATPSSWTDLDQMAALVLNGLAPLLFSSKAVIQSARRSTIWAKCEEWVLKYLREIKTRQGATR